MSTPRTDALAAKFQNEASDDLSGAYGEALDLCEQLELELAAASAVSTRDYCEACGYTDSHDPNCPRPRDVIAPRRLMQTEFGEHGNCQSACLAMMLGLSLDDVPNFSATPGDDNAKFKAQTEWLAARGLWLLTVVKWQSLPWPPPHGFYIAGGPSPRGFRHSVIFKDRQLWHDPHPEGGGITEVQDVDFIMPMAQG